MQRRRAKYSHAADYFEVAKAALAEMVHQQPQPIWDENGMLTKGVLVRHLVLPVTRGNPSESCSICMRYTGNPSF